MTRFGKLLYVVGLASVTLMQLPCVNTGSGLAIPALKPLGRLLSISGLGT